MGNIAKWLSSGAEPGQLVFGWLTLMVLVAPLTSASGHTSPGLMTPTAELRARLLLGDTKTASRRAVKLELRNTGKSSFAVPKPMFPTRWVVVRHYLDQGLWQTDEHPGGRGPGRASVGHEDRYPEAEYVTVQPGLSFEITEDLDWYLAFPASTVLPGKYIVRFFYDYEPTKDESRFRILSERLESNAIEVQVDLAKGSQN